MAWTFVISLVVLMGVLVFFVVMWRDGKKFEEERRRGDVVVFKDDEHGLAP